MAVIVFEKKKRERRPTWWKVYSGGEGWVVFDDSSAVVLFRSKDRHSLMWALEIANWLEAEGKQVGMLDIDIYCEEARKVLERIGEGHLLSCAEARRV